MMSSFTKLRLGKEWQAMVEHTDRILEQIVMPKCHVGGAKS